MQGRKEIRLIRPTLLFKPAGTKPELFTIRFEAIGSFITFTAMNIVGWENDSFLLLLKGTLLNRDEIKQYSFHCAIIVQN